jgi:hypothetical protein
MDKKYRIVFLGLLEREEAFRERMSRFGVPANTAELILQKAPVVLKGHMSLKDARQYADAVQYAGGRVNIKEHGLLEESEIINRSVDIKPFENFVMCPQCGYKQLKEEACVKCGNPFEQGKTE